MISFSPRIPIIAVLVVSLFQLSFPFAYGFSKRTKSNSSPKPAFKVKHPPRVQQNGNLKITQVNPVVNEKNQIPLTASDLAGQPVTGVTWESGSPDIASVDPQTGVVKGVDHGFATITARRGTDSVSTFVVVARVESGQSPNVPGDAKLDIVGRFYISDPRGNVVLRKTEFTMPVSVYAGKQGAPGLINGDRQAAQFAGPTAVAVDNTADGGIIVADTLNHSIRKISFRDQVTTLMGNGSPGITPDDVTPISNVRLSSPRGVTVDTGGNLFVADTNNHAIYYVNFEKQVATLLAGQPGQPGKADGQGRAARFNRPAGISLSQDGRFVIVADEGNGRVRLITRSGKVATLGKASTARGIFENLDRLERVTPLVEDQASDEIAFNLPESVSVDAGGDIYVVDASTVSVVTRPLEQFPQVVALAQSGSFLQASSVYISEAETYVLDAKAENPNLAEKLVTIGAPMITSVSPNIARIEGGTEVVITGKNFSPESQVSLGNSEAQAMVESATRIRFTVPPQIAPGILTLSVQTRGGIAQQPLSIVSKPFSELKTSEITTVAGGIPFLGDGGLAVNAALNFGALESEPAGGVVVDGLGNVLIADPKHHRIRRVDTLGEISTIVGNGLKGFSGDGGLAIRASLDQPQAVTIDGAGNLYLVDFGNNRIRRVDAMTGIISTVAGGGNGDSIGDGGPATRASLFRPLDVFVSSNSDLLIADSGNNRIRKVDIQTGIISTVVGDGKGKFGGDNGPATQASLNFPIGVVLDSNGTMFISDGFNHRIRRVDSSGIITTYAGNGFEGQYGQGGFTGDGGPATSASLSIPAGLVLDIQGNLLLSDFFNHRIRKVDSQTRIISTVAGNGDSSFTGDGGLATNAGMDGPLGLAIDGAGDLFVVDTGHDRVRRIMGTTGIIFTIAGSGSARFYGEGDLAIQAGLYRPYNLSLDSQGNLFIADTGNFRFRRVDVLTGKIQTVVGDGTLCCNDAEGASALQTSILNGYGVAVDPTGSNLFLSLRDGGLVRKVTNGIITTVAGGGKNGLGDNGPATAAVLNSPYGLALDSLGNLFIADQSNHRIRRVDAKTGMITTVAGSGPTGYDNGGFGGDNGPATSARLNLPVGVAVDLAGNIFVADYYNFRVRVIDAQTKIIRTVAGGGNQDNGDGGPATSDILGVPTGLAVDAAGNLFIATGDTRVRRVDAKTGIITTVAGSLDRGNSGDGKLAASATLTSAISVALDRNGNLYISDNESNVVRVVKGVGVGMPSDTQPPTVSNVTLSKKKVVRKKDATLGINWVSNDNTGVVAHDLLFASDGVNFSTTILSGLPGNVRQFTWMVPASLAKTQTGVVKVVARDAAGNSGSGVSPTISIK